MSKSYNNTLPLFGEEKALQKLVMRIPTDSTPVEDPKPTDDSIILDLYRLFASDDEFETMKVDFAAGGTGYGEYKKQLFAAYRNHFAPMQEKRAELETKPQQVEEILQEGALRAQALAAPVLERFRSATGLGG